ncbi:uncharacterized protein BDW43DRAFT_279468 [Aspergillus alliaceus]|uniref:uncharacterized protein n=1 Tax=Petromyces alliaceus TaxID=209559 RepID=UPI0012A4B839|nr:uncharacterized protein BDW43DRAFT_279468 [Aspergillus alliaceus]KAB8232468.1 hypothetical protein BDW43DRAFT_279468 [Aspergillus alliaceus]
MCITILRVISATLRAIWLFLLRPLAILITTGAVISVYRAGFAVWKEAPTILYELAISFIT